MRNKFIRTLGMLAVAAVLLPTGSCTKDLDQEPTYLASAEVIYRDPAQILQVLARLYGGLAVTGQTGGNGPGTAQPDLSFIDEGYSNYIRAYFKAQELTTDEAIIAWGDAGLPDYNRLTWNADNQFIRAMYERIFFQISACNEFIRQTSDDKLASRGITGAEADNIRQYQAEARFLRALSYFHAIDMFGNVPFVTETSAVGENPRQGTRAEVYTYIESELRAIEPLLLAPRAVYARADKGACWALQTKLYLNAKVYNPAVTGNFDAAAVAADKLLRASAGYSLTPNYTHLFLADNDRAALRNEIIFPVAFDGINTQNYGGTTFLVHGSVGGSMDAAAYGIISGGWFGMRARRNLVDLFPGFPGATTDQRALFYTAGQNLEITDPSAFTDGYAVTKWRNVSSAGVPGKDVTGTFADTDFPMFRLGDVKLMYAEAVLRGAAPIGTTGSALQAVNDVRVRAGATPLASFTGDGLQNILDERGRELYWEGSRRTDLIRFGKYVSGYNWPFKGNRGASDITTGRDVEPFRVLFPIPTTDLVANPNIKQNTGY
jgi:hypothetical protein